MDRRDGRTWAAELRDYSSLEYVVRDGGVGLSKGISLVQSERPELTDGLDVFHTLHEGGRALRKTWAAASRALEAADHQQRQFDRLWRQGKSRQGKGGPLKRAWQIAEERMDEADQADQAFEQIKQAFSLFTPEGILNDRNRAEQVIGEQLPHLTGRQWNKMRRLLQRPESFSFLDRLHEGVAQLEFDEQELHSALRFEGLRRYPSLLRDETAQAAAARGLMLMGRIRLKKDPGWRKVVEEVRRVLRRCWRASSLVEGINSVARMHQSRHRRMPQGLALATFAGTRIAAPPFPNTLPIPTRLGSTATFSLLAGSIAAVGSLSPPAPGCRPTGRTAIAAEWMPGLKRLLTTLQKANTTAQTPRDFLQRLRS